MPGAISNAIDLSDLGGAFAYYNLNVWDEFGGSAVLFIGQNKAGPDDLRAGARRGRDGKLLRPHPGAVRDLRRGVRHLDSQVQLLLYPAEAACDAEHWALGGVNPAGLLGAAKQLVCEAQRLIS